MPPLPPSPAPETSATVATVPRPRRLALLLALVAPLVLGTVTLMPGLAPPALAAVPPELQRTEDVVTADALPTVQIDDGYVWAQTMIGDTVYAAGDFDNARAPLASPGTQLTPRTNALAFDITTGELDADWAPEVNGPVKAVAASPDGSRIYIGGSFSRVNGESRWNIAALDAATGELVDGFRPAVGGSGVYSLVAEGDTVYAGGLFTQANGSARTNLAAFATRDGALRAWAPETDHQVDAMVADPAGRDIILGGRFLGVNGDTSLRGIGAVDRTTGAIDAASQLPDSVSSSANGSLRGKAGIFSLAADDGGIYGTAWVAGATSDKFEGTFAAEAGTGALRWVADCHGDHYGVFSTGETVYTAAHTYSCTTAGSNPQQRPTVVRRVEAYTADARGTLARGSAGYRNWQGTPAPSTYAWRPQLLNGTASGLDQAALSITGTEDIISVAGEFVGVNNGRHQGIVRFSTDPPGGPAQGPRLDQEDWPVELLDGTAGATRVSVPGVWDRDDLSLTYELWREDLDEPVDTATVDSPWWNPPELELTDTTAAPAGERTYTVAARDGDGNTMRSAPLTADATGTDPPPYAEAVLADEPMLYYPLGDTAGAWTDTADARVGAGVTASAEGIANSSTGSSHLDGGRTATFVPAVAGSTAPPEFTTEVWMRSSSTQGGQLVSFGNQATSDSRSFDRKTYMSDDGRMVFGTWDGRQRVIRSADSYNDGAWHHVVATLDASGMTLYVDGEVVARNATWTTASPHTGYWRVGSDNIGRWTYGPSSRTIDGELDEVAVYDHALTPEQIRSHHQLGRG